MEEYVDKNDIEIYEQISKIPKLRERHYKIKDINGPKNFQNFEPIYPYREYQLRLPAIGTTVYQVMFPCLTRRRYSKVLVHYYIAYAWAAGERFLFWHEPHQSALALKALVEFTPIWVPFESRIKLQEFYVNQRETAGIGICICTFSLAYQLNYHVGEAEEVKV